MSYRDLLNKLLSLGPKLPQIMAAIQRIVTEIQIIRSLIAGEELLTEAAPELSAADAALEQQVITAAMGGPETFAGPFSRILDFIRANPELIAFLLQFLKK